MFAGPLALTIAALFTGAAIYINIAEQPARLQLDDSSLLVEWKLAYRRGYMMQTSLAIVGGFFGVVAFFITFQWRWPLGAVVLLAHWPCTIFVIMPTYHRLMNTPPGLIAMVVFCGPDGEAAMRQAPDGVVVSKIAWPAEIHEIRFQSPSRVTPFELRVIAVAVPRQMKA